MNGRAPITSVHDALLEQNGVRLLNAPTAASQLAGLRVDQAMRIYVHSRGVLSLLRAP